MGMIVSTDQIANLDEGQELTVRIREFVPDITYGDAHLTAKVVGWDKHKHRVYVQTKLGFIMGLPNEPHHPNDYRHKFFDDRASSVESWNHDLDMLIEKANSVRDSRVEVLSRAKQEAPDE